ncbi:DUF3253 domain-containing protein [Sphingomonas donggukensis]|uniref:DUF3253 domain-containing protein n=1 Tax=Sphingomonas donggukensis TaxID=2949093 RepID=A0ABY4TZH6_9SPHN|nr:DUF3253 domain-containing protein [Sphingomonas donggukensis]URW77056.1 DUF3253 domain-containing protein [Sphingomonas donggukensis]
MSAAPTSRDARTATLALLATRAEGATICPSEVARTLAAAAGTEDWRAAMPIVHTAVDGLVTDGLIRLSWKGDAKPTRKGPYRIARPASGDR